MRQAAPVTTIRQLMRDVLIGIMAMTFAAHTCTVAIADASSGNGSAVQASDEPSDNSPIVPPVKRVAPRTPPTAAKPASNAAKTIQPSKPNKKSGN